MALRYKPEDLLLFAADLFAAAGMPRERCWVVAEMLLEADLMGHDTHGLNLAVHVWTINETTDMQRLLDLGVDGIVTDRPDRLLSLLRKPGGD